MKKQAWTYCPVVDYIWNGAHNDPELHYKGVTLNYWDVENILWEDFKFTQSSYADITETNFLEFCKENKDFILSLFKN